MDHDIGHLLNNWDFEPDEFLARRIQADDGSEKIQIRIDMGILQLETAGRPDGALPFGYSSTGLPRSANRSCKEDEQI